MTSSWLGFRQGLPYHDIKWFTLGPTGSSLLHTLAIISVAAAVGSMLKAAHSPVAVVCRTHAHSTGFWSSACKTDGSSHGAGEVTAMAALLLDLSQHRALLHSAACQGLGQISRCLQSSSKSGAGGPDGAYGLGGTMVSSVPLSQKRQLPVGSQQQISNESDFLE